jgi:hypothetical protein
MHLEMSVFELRSAGCPGTDGPVRAKPFASSPLNAGPAGSGVLLNNLSIAITAIILQM